MRGLTGDNRIELQTLRDEYEQLFGQILERGQRVGAFDIEDLALSRLAILEMCTGVAHWYRPGGRLELEDVQRFFVSTTCKLLSVPSDELHGVEFIHDVRKLDRRARDSVLRDLGNNCTERIRATVRALTAPRNSRLWYELNMQLPADSHVHSEWSWDTGGPLSHASGRMQQTCARTRSSTSTAISTASNDADNRFPELRILTGVEFGQPHLHEAQASHLLDLGVIDRVLGFLAHPRSRRRSE